MRTRLIVVACVVALSGCGQASEYTSEDAAEGAMMEVAPAGDAAASAGEPTAPAPATPRHPRCPIRSDRMLRKWRPGDRLHSL